MSVTRGSGDDRLMAAVHTIEYADGKNQNKLRPEDIESLSFVTARKCQMFARNFSPR